ncbi:ABC transporter ATP-binding protein [Marichromatium bheemlicum]|uniref:ABC transporter ATP-binding protein n=1 Tax=Marichromatium bheemlicum TaxID=365339 RepID=A0ABX1I9V8_9GAMM|nr:ABC transporter ATP-binding protein [Marichromatium bheemlicum]NKN34307.1 ABC transporter ATP-binding protein [Marichromatium bheemlicum]
MSLLRVEGLEVRVGARVLLREVALALEAGELLGVVGPNGSGKSTLVKAIAQLLPHRGAVWLDGDSLARLSARQRARRLAYLGQDDGVRWPTSVADLVALGRHPWQSGGWGGASAARDREAVERALDAAEVEALRERRLDTLSGGERARARLARALAVEAPLLLADEPIAAADPRHQLRIMELLRAHCTRGAGVVLVLHDLTLASRFCDRLLLLHQGQVLAQGRPEQVLDAAKLRTAYGIEVLGGSHQGERYLIPWRCVETD